MQELWNAEALRSTIGRLSPQHRAMTASLALWRLSVVAEHPRTDAIIPTVGDLIADSTQYVIDWCRQGSSNISAEGLNLRFRSLIGTEDDPIDEPPLPAAWLVDLASVADHATLAWSRPADSAQSTFNALIGASNLAGSFEEDSDVQVVEPLSDPEYARQLTDARLLSASGGAPVFEDLIAASSPLRDAYARRYDEVLAPFGR